MPQWSQPGPAEAVGAAGPVTPGVLVWAGMSQGKCGCLAVAEGLLCLGPGVVLLSGSCRPPYCPALAGELITLPVLFSAAPARLTLSRCLENV